MNDKVVEEAADSDPSGKSFRERDEDGFREAESEVLKQLSTPEMVQSKMQQISIKSLSTFHSPMVALFFHHFNFCVFPDFTQSKARSWWADLVKEFIANGVDGIWNDMNEPAIFKIVTKTKLVDNVHMGDSELGGRQRHSFYHNVYGMLMARSTYEGMKLADRNTRPFVLTRAGFIGSHRYAATWTGDNLSTWEHLHMSISMVLQLCEEVCRLALKRRYRLIPHIYTLFYMAHTTGTPVATPTFLADPKDFSLRKAECSFLLGSLLDLPALYLRGRSIIPVATPHQHVGQASPSDDFTLLVALNEHGRVEGVLFKDDGDGYELTKGGYLLTYYSAELQTSVVILTVSKTEGSWKRPKRRLNVKLFLGGGAMIDSWAADGDTVSLALPSKEEASQLVAASEEQYRTRMATARRIPEIEDVSGKKGVELSGSPVELKCGDWSLKVVPWIGGRIIFMEHLPTDAAKSKAGLRNVRREDRSVVKWLAPPSGRIKINVNVATRVTGATMVGIVARDHNGYVQMAAGRSYPQLLDPMVGETLAIKAGLELAKAVGMKSIIIESDCQGAVRMLNGGTVDLSTQGKLITD
ncbi:hypothetical protein Drorol1_Dr00013425 [Drosera rotundifolia]